MHVVSSLLAGLTELWRLLAAAGVERFGRDRGRRLIDGLQRLGVGLAVDALL
jgi:hypothetical protein